jgi:hypothetical protein
VVPAVADVFEIREQPGIDLFRSVVGHLTDRRLLIVLDNGELFAVATPGAGS